jgi:hypothetical protein
MTQIAIGARRGWDCSQLPLSDFPPSVGAKRALVGNGGRVKP